MSDVIVDRRGQGGGSHVNRGRFIERMKPWIKEAVQKKAGIGSITDSHKDGEDITIPKKGIQEPRFRHGTGGNREYVHPGNDRFIPGDKIPRPKGGSGGGKKGSPDGEGEDDFVFHLTRKEFLEIYFEDCELPNMIKTELFSGIDEYKWKRAGITTAGNPTNLDLVRSFRQSLARRIVFGKKDKEELLCKLEGEMALLLALPDPDEKARERVIAVAQEITLLKQKLRGIPFIDTSDLRFRQFAKVPEPTAQAVMFCIMDVSISMDKNRKDIAKRFFLLLYLFLTRNYERTDVVFIKHHTIAEEVVEKEFFESTETGGTVVSTGLRLMKEIIDERYSDSSWNRYVAQASDGENWSLDSNICEDMLVNEILSVLRYFAYVQIEKEKQDELWANYLRIAEESVFKDRFAMKFIREQKDIYPVFHELFKKKENA